MDTTDPDIVFYSDGTCSHCRHAKKYISNAAPRYKLSDIVAHIKSSSLKVNSQYDCIIGLSGGVDSSWLLHLLKNTDLKIYLLHVDTGWNTGAAVSNVFNLCNAFDIKLNSFIIDWEIMRKLQVAFFYSGVINQDMPQDIAIFSAQLKACINNRIPIIASGANNTTESILPPAWGHHWHDISNLSAIYSAFWNKNIERFPYCSYSDICAYRLGHHTLKCRPINILDFIPYEKKIALHHLVSNYNYKPYEQKHGESAWTLYYQAIYLPQVFNIDKRKAHFSNLIVNGDMERADALDVLSKPKLTQKESLELVNLISLKLKIPYEHARNPGKYILANSHYNFRSSARIFDKYVGLYANATNDKEKDFVFTSLTSAN